MRFFYSLHHVMKYFLVIIAILFCTAIHAQTDPILDNYLASHRYIIKQATDSSLSFPDDKIPQLLQKCMRGKLMFVYGESFSHKLHFNSYILRLFIQYFEAHGLKYYFEESARSWVVEDDIYYHTPNVTVDSIMKDLSPFTRRFYELEKEVYLQGHYEYKAIDFERRQTFHTTLALLLSRVSPQNLEKLYTLAPYTKDTTYTTLSPKKFVAFYEALRDTFFNDSNSYKPLLGDMYPYFRYLMSDSLPSVYQDNRDKNMALHVLQQIQPLDTNAIYVLDQGMAHTDRSRDNIFTKSTVAYLQESDILKDKILITDTYCDNCNAANSIWGMGSNDMFKYMKTSVLASFHKAAANDKVVLFDLTELPKKYAYLQARHNDLLIYAQNQD